MFSKFIVYNRRMNIKEDTQITNHASRRLKERGGFNKKSYQEIADRAVEKGLDHSELNGNLKKFVDGMACRSKSGNLFKIYSEKLFIFHDNILITVIHLPNNLKKIANKLAKKND